MKEIFAIRLEKYSCVTYINNIIVNQGAQEREGVLTPRAEAEEEGSS